MNHWNNKSQKQWTNRQTSKATHQTVHSSNQQINKLANHRIQRIWGCEFGKINHCGVFTFSAWCGWCENQVNDQNSTLAGLSLLTIRTVILAFYIARWTTKMLFNFQQKSDHGTKEGLNLNCLLLGGKLIKLIQFGILKCFSVEPYTGTLESSNLIERHFLRGLTTV